TVFCDRFPLTPSCLRGSELTRRLMKQSQREASHEEHPGGSLETTPCRSGGCHDGGHVCNGDHCSGPRCSGSSNAQVTACSYSTRQLLRRRRSDQRRRRRL